MNVKPGDLAICLAGENTPEMAGLVVEVVRRAVAGEFIGQCAVPISKDAAAHPVWVIRMGGRQMPLRTRLGKFFMVTERGYQDRLLRPVTGLPVDDEVIDDLKEPAI